MGGKKLQLHSTYLTNPTRVMVRKGLDCMACVGFVECVRLVSAFWEEGAVGLTEAMPEYVVGYTELGCSKLKKGKGFLEPNFELVPSC